MINPACLRGQITLGQALWFTQYTLVYEWKAITIGGEMDLGFEKQAQNSYFLQYGGTGA